MITYLFVQVVICTSLVWILLDTIIIMNIRDCPVEHVTTKAEQSHDSFDLSSSPSMNVKTDSPGFLKRIMPAGMLN